MTNENFVYVFRSDAGALERRAGRAGAKLSGMGVAQRAAVTSDCRSCGSDHDDG
jgi:hypothetical protein